VEWHRVIKGVETARMYAVVDPQPPMDRHYGVTSFELG